MATLQSSIRPLNKAEERLLRWALRVRKRRLQKSFRRMLAWGAVVFGGLWGLSIFATLADSRGPSWYISGLIWVAIILPLGVWAYIDVRSDLVRAVPHFEGALRDKIASVIRIQADRVIEFEEEEDEGACYAFQLDGSRIIFVSGQEFYSSARFPNNDFALVDLRSGDGSVAVQVIEKRDHKISPMRTIKVEMKATLKIPAHLQVIDGDVNEIEQLLS